MNSVLIILFLVIVPNVWATWCVARSELAQRRKTVLILWTWIIPIVGSWVALKEIPSFSVAPRAAPVSAALAVPEAAPESLELPGGANFSVTGNLLDGNGLPILDWQALDTWATAAATPAEKVAAIDRGRRAWLLHFRDWKGGALALHETDQVWMLSSYQARIAQKTAEYIAVTRRRIMKVLGDLAVFPSGTRSIVLVLDTLDDYYNYVANYYPDEGEFSFSGGMHINSGCPHFVTVVDNLAHIEPVIAHELTHSALAHLRLPLWLDEGIAVVTEHQISISHRYPRQTLEKLAQHREFWNAGRVQEFWSGESFHRTDEGNALSYDMARAIVELLGREWQTFSRFARNAARADAGAAAAAAELKMDLGQLAAAALGLRPQADWGPNPAAWRE